MEIDDIRMPLTSADVTAERLEKLKELFPEAFAEGKVDFERLRQTLGDLVETGRERYGLSWAGKADAIRAIQTPSVGTLIPVPKESVNFDETDNLIIEGENLEVLKLLQKSYHGKVKMIYIDPPYNTGNEFIYPDDYKEPPQAVSTIDRASKRRGRPVDDKHGDIRAIPLQLAVNDVSAALPGAESLARRWRHLRFNRRSRSAQLEIAHG